MLLEKVPAGRAVHTLHQMLSEICLLRMLHTSQRANPALHSRLDIATVEFALILHAVHSTEPAGEKEPLWHGLHKAGDGEEPARHITQLVPMLLAQLECLPAGQARQFNSDATPSSVEYLPAEQSRHAVRDAAPVTLEYLPAAHAIQSMDTTFYLSILSRLTRDTQVAERCAYSN